MVSKSEYTVEYINNQWYYTNWDTEEHAYTAGVNDLVKYLSSVGLGTEDEPYKRIEVPEPGPSGQDYRVPEGTESEENKSESDKEEKSDEDTPTVTRQASQIIEQLAEQLAGANLNYTPPLRLTYQAEKERRQKVEKELEQTFSNLFERTMTTQVSYQTTQIQGNPDDQGSSS